MLMLCFRVRLKNRGCWGKCGKERKVLMIERDEVDEAQLHVVFGVVDLYLKLWGRTADVIRGAEEVGLGCRDGERPRTSYFLTSLS